MLLLHVSEARVRPEKLRDVTDYLYTLTEINVTIGVFSVCCEGPRGTKVDFQHTWDGSWGFLMGFRIPRRELQLIFKVRISTLDVHTY